MQSANNKDSSIAFLSEFCYHILPEGLLHKAICLIQIARMPEHFYKIKIFIVTV